MAETLRRSGSPVCAQLDSAGLLCQAEGLTTSLRNLSAGSYCSIAIVPGQGIALRTTTAKMAEAGPYVTLSLKGGSTARLRAVLSKAVA